MDLELKTLLLHMNLNVHANYGAVFIGSSLSFFLYGIICCQVSSYFSSYPKDNIWMKSLVGIVTLSETVNACLLVPAMWHYIIRRGFGSVDRTIFLLCDDWSIVRQAVPSELTCLLVECFFQWRMLQLLSKKKLVLFSDSTLVKMNDFWTGKSTDFRSDLMEVFMNGVVREKCYPALSKNAPWMYSAYITRIISDGIIVGMMCYQLYKRRSQASQFSNTLRLIRTLIVWTIVSGFFMWCSAVGYIITYTLLTASRLMPIAIYFVRARIHANTMLAMFVSGIICITRPTSY
ncbi:hypothetical protein BDQ17DRAFT_1406055 [Cyathus striatus]|nr:hypothetical protein BDQ17DRAFT_1406055 [Cyathus striatus]